MPDQPGSDPSDGPANGQHSCEHDGCTCPDYMPGGAAFDFCQREECGHRDVEHRLQAEDFMTNLSKDQIKEAVAKLRSRAEKRDDPDGVCHLLRNGTEQYSEEAPENLCKAACDQMNESDQTGNWTYVWNPIA